MSEIADTQARGVVTLDSIIRSALMDLGAGMERYETFRHWAIEGLRDFHFDMAQEIRTVQLSLTAWKAIELPTDFVDWAMLGVVVNNQIQCFTNDERISLFREDADENGEIDPIVAPVDTTIRDSNPNDRLWFWNNYNANGEYTGQLFGLTVKFNGVGYFRMNKERREIQFSPNIDGNTKIYLEYISDGYNPSEKTVVNIYAAKLIKLYIHWQRTKYSNSATVMAKREAKDDYWNEYSKVQNRLNPITVADVLECARDAYRLVPSL
jgi:hypothetical protein